MGISINVLVSKRCLAAYAAPLAPIDELEIDKMDFIPGTFWTDRRVRVEVPRFVAFAAKTFRIFFNIRFSHINLGTYPYRVPGSSTNRTLQDRPHSFSDSLPVGRDHCLVAGDPMEGGCRDDLAPLRRRKPKPVKRFFSVYLTLACYLHGQSFNRYHNYTLSISKIVSLSSISILRFLMLKFSKSFSSSGNHSNRKPFKRFITYCFNICNIPFFNLPNYI
jgi:hypothetical protein